MSRVGVDLTTIGIFALVGTPYAFKFVWSPLVDRMPLPLLDRLLGRRRGWMLLAQVGIVLSACSRWPSAIRATTLVDRGRARGRRLLLGDPGHRHRRLPHRDPDRRAEQGAGSATTQLGYRIALWIVDAMALLLPTLLPWPVVLA